MRQRPSRSAVTAFDAARGRPVRDVPAWAFALLPPVGFAIQELLELSLHTGTFGWRAVLAPTFLPGLLLQLPFALAAYVAARLLLRAAGHVGRALAPPVGAPAAAELGARRPAVAARRPPRRGEPRSRVRLRASPRSDPTRRHTT